MEQCIHFEICHLDEEEAGSGLCILHSKNPSKDISAFRVVFRKHCESGSDFSHIVFPGDTEFPDKFEKRAIFNYCTFFDKVYFNSKDFSSGASFTQTNFLNEVFFDRSEFKDIIYFFKTNFHKMVSFSQTIFNDAPYFQQVTFTDGVDFSYAKFSKEPSFYNFKFKGRAGFVGAEFANARGT